MRTSFSDALRAEADAALAPVDAELARRYPGERPGRQPVHTVYVPADALAGHASLAALLQSYGEQALALLDACAPEPDALAAAVGARSGPEAAEIHRRVRAKLLREPVEDLRLDFEDGYGHRSDAEEDAAAVAAALAVARAVAEGAAPPFLGIRAKCLEAHVRARGIRTLDVFLSTLLDACGGALPAGLVLTLPKVSHPAQTAVMAGLLTAFEQANGLAAGRLGFEIQIETTQAVLGPDGTATVARLIDAAAGRATALHYGTFDYSAACGIAPAWQSPDHPAADHAKAVMQTAAAGTGVRLSDGSTNVLPTGTPEQVHAAWRLHHGLVRRALERGYYQGWDMHPGHLPTRYAAVYGFFREGLAPAAGRVAAYAAGATAANGGVLDEPATARALSAYLLRGLDCGALDPAEVVYATGLPRAALAALAGREGTESQPGAAP